MLYEKLHNGDKLPKIGLGTWNMGGGMTPDYSQDEQVLNAIRSALEMGYTHIDTAEMYANGHTEELIREAIRDYDRESIQITTKVWHTHLYYHGTRRAIDGSLGRLDTKYLDYFLIHWPSRDMNLPETFKAINEAVDDGKIRHVGVSNFSIEQIQEAQALCNTPIVTNQVPYSLTNREYVTNGMLEYCQDNGIILTAYTPIDKGRIMRNSAVQAIAAKHGATPIQVALNWLIRQPRVVTIPMSMNPMHLAENLGAIDFELTVEEIIQLDNLKLT